MSDIKQYFDLLEQRVDEEEEMVDDIGYVLQVEFNLRQSFEINGNSYEINLEEGMFDAKSGVKRAYTNELAQAKWFNTWPKAKQEADQRNNMINSRLELEGEDQLFPLRPKKAYITLVDVKYP